MSEYVLAGVLVAMVGVGSLLILADSFSAGLPSLLDRIFGVAAAPSQTPQPSAIAPSGVPDSGPSPHSPAPTLVSSNTANTGASNGQTSAAYQSVSITLSSGQVLKLDMPADLKSIVETSGTNGVTQAYAQQIQTLAETLKDSGAISAGQASTLEKLANQGHRMARAEKAIESAAASFGDSEAFDKGTVEFDGQTVAISDLADSVSHGELVDDFMTLYYAARDSGALEDDGVKLVVQAMYKDIKALADVFETSVDDVANGNASPAELNQLNASQVSHSDSANICHAGKGKDSGVQCN